MGLFSNLFSKKKTAAVQPQPVQMPEEKKPRYIIKNQRFILDNVKDHMEDIMDLVDENEDYKMKDRDFIDEKQENENLAKLKELKADVALKLKSLNAKNKIANKYAGNIEPQEGSILDFSE